MIATIDIISRLIKDHESQPHIQTIESLESDLERLQARFDHMEKALSELANKEKR